MSIIFKVVSSNPVHGKMYLIQHYVIEFVSYLRQVCGEKNQVPSTNKTDHNDITEIFLQVVLNTINQKPSTLFISVIKQQLYTKPYKHDM